ncbi:MAG: hypothetical protein JJT99_08230 [Rhodobacteraceae bacterium]|nr:hypothetical protein [Paracoccaceae bacterium]
MKKLDKDELEMKKLEAWEEHWKLKEPGKSKQIGEAIAAGMRDIFRKNGYDVDELMRTYDEQEHRRRRRQREIEHYSKFDLSILKALDLTLDDVLNLKKEKARRKGAASKRPETADKQKPKFLEIVIQCESEGLNFAQTLRRLTQKLTVTERTLRTWLSELVESPHCDIPPPRRKGKG